MEGVVEILLHRWDIRDVDLGLDERGRVEVSLGADLKVDTSGRVLGVVDRLGAGLNVGGHAVVIRGGEGRQVAEAVERDGVFGRAVANGRSVLRDLAVGHVVRSLSTDKETVTANNGVGSEGGAL